MTRNSKRTALVMAGLVMASLAVGAALAAPGSVDSTATDTSDITYVSDGETIDTEFNGSLGDDTTYGLPITNATGAGADDLAMNVTTSSGLEVYSFSGSWDTYASGESDTSTDYIHNWTDADMMDVPRGPNENVTLTVHYWNESKDPQNQTPTEITVYVETTEEQNVQRLTSDSSFGDVEDADVAVYEVLTEEHNVTTVDDSADINGTNTTVIYTLSDSNVSDPFDHTTSEMETVGALTFVQLDVEGDDAETVPVFYKSTPSWYDSEDMGTYAVYDPTDERLSVHPQGENFEGEDQMDVEATTEAYGATDTYTVWKLAGGYDGSGLEAIWNLAM